MLFTTYAGMDMGRDNGGVVDLDRGLRTLGVPFAVVGALVGTCWWGAGHVASPLLAMWKTREPKWAKLEARYGESAAKAASGEKSGE